MPQCTAMVLLRALMFDRCASPGGQGRCWPTYPAGRRVADEMTLQRQCNVDEGGVVIARGA
ncbi:hypothetical protein A6P55_18405 [Pandoraea pnomenusa]|nr:hypothetical protein A6P55_18405 [Pandoraea pnomenusa]